MLTDERRHRTVEMLRVLRQDVEDDVARRDGQLFTGANVAAGMGEMCAQIKALASVLIAILEDDDESAKTSAAESGSADA